MPEICGEAALMLSPDEPGAWIDAIVRLAGDAALRERLVEAGHARVRRFSWTSSARIYLDLIARTVRP
nr:hypothetical protein [Methylobacterium sp.]USU34670.1 hypothetical protein NG677_23945 [Methylobacterium sp.]